MPSICQNCTHEWHGLPCAHHAVVRQGWFLVKETCACQDSLGDSLGQAS